MANRASALFARAGEQPDAPAILFEGRTITFGELARSVAETAAGLARIGVGKGARVGLLIGNSPDFVIAQQALFALGAVMSPLNILYRAGEIGHVVRSCALDYLIVQEALIAQLPARSDAGLGPLKSVIVIDDDQERGKGWKSLPAAIGRGEAVFDLAEVAEDDVVMLLNTSATTGKSKGVMLTAGNLAANYDRTPGWLGLDGSDVILCALPLYNTFGLNQCINVMLTTGAPLVLLPRFDAQRCIEAIATHGCTFLPAVPTMLQKIVDHPALKPGSLGSLRRIMTGGAPVPAPLLKRVLIASPHVTVLTGYGLTEGTALVTLTQVRLGADGEVERGKTIGRVLDGMQVRIEDPEGRVVGPGAVGEIVVRGPNVMRGYFNAPDDTAAALVGGWLHTGDLGCVSVDGYAYIVDRKKDVIIRGGQNIYPAEIEEILYQMPGVAEAAVVAGWDDVLGEVPVAFVALQPSAKLSAPEMIERCRSELAYYKVPVSVHIERELPKGPTGKILRRALKSTLPMCSAA